MDNWFTVEAIDAETYAISEYRHWEQPHCYLLCGTKRAILIDTGLGVSNLKDVVDCLTRLPVTVVTTHAHWDHIGGHRHFARFAVHEAEQDWLSVQFPIPLQVVQHNLLRKPCAFPADFVPENYRIFHGTPTELLHGGDCLELGNRTLQVIHTPGHSPGHCCFYEPERKYLYAGDLIYQGCLDAFYPSTDPQQFYRSIQTVRTLDVRKILPGHYQLQLPTAIIGHIEAGFRRISDAGKLAHGGGLFDFGTFQIHL